MFILRLAAQVNNAADSQLGQLFIYRGGRSIEVAACQRLLLQQVRRNFVHYSCKILPPPAGVSDLGPYNDAAHTVCFCAKKM